MFRIAGPGRIATFLVPGLAYAAVAWLSPHQDGAILSLTDGVALAAIIAFGPAAAPGIFLSAFLVGLRAFDPVTSVLGAMGQILAAGAGAWLVARFAGGPRWLERPRHIFGFALIVLGVSAPIHATMQLLAATVSSPLPGAVNMNWTMAWWAAVAGDLTITPALVAWARQTSRTRRDDWYWRRRAAGSRAWVQLRVVELAMLAAASVALAVSIGVAQPAVSGGLWAVLLFPLLSWAALRFGPQETGLLMVLLSGGILWSAAHGHAPVGAAPDATWLVSLGLSLVSVTGFTIAASTEHRGQHQTRLRQLAVTDPLTGLANFRHLTESIERHVQRSQKRHETFAVLLLDVDGLKAINDRDGHAAGSRLLMRLADHLRQTCRASDLLARQGGDEFAVVLPGCDQAAAEAQSARILANLANDRETPKISVSLGIAVFPRDGATCDELLDRADRGLYAKRAQVRSAPSLREA